MSKKIYLIIIIILLLLLGFTGYYIFVIDAKRDAEFEELVNEKIDSLYLENGYTISLDSVNLIIYNDDSYAKEVDFNFFNDERDDEFSLPVLRILEEESYNGYFLNLYLGDKLVDKLVLNENYELSKEDYDKYIEEVNEENLKKGVKIGNAFASASGVNIYFIKNEGFAISYDFSGKGGYTTYKLAFYTFDGKKVGNSYTIGDASALSYSDFSNFEFDGAIFRYWDLDCDNSIAVKKSLQLKNGDIVEKNVDESRKIYKVAKEESIEYLDSFICD